MIEALWIEFEATSPKGETRTTKYHASTIQEIEEHQARGRAQGWQFSEPRVVFGAPESIEQIVARKLGP